MKNIALALCGCLTIAACSSTEGGGDYGRVGPAVVKLYDMVADDGAMELEIDRNGTIFEAEADIEPASVPQRVMEAARAAAGPGAVVTGAEVEYGDRGRTWEVKFERAGVGMEFVVDATGRILEQERSLLPSEAPAAVLSNGMSAVPGTFRSIEILKIGEDMVQYHVKTVSGSAHYKVVLDGEGNVLRAVREVRAEIEIPLR